MVYVISWSGDAVAWAAQGVVGSRVFETRRGVALRDLVSGHGGVG